MVTEADFASQEVVCQDRPRRFPRSLPCWAKRKSAGSPCVVEPTPRIAGSSIRWTERPISSTACRHFSVSLALQHGDTLLAGAIFNPVADEMFTATLGGGAFLNGRPIHASAVSSMADALAAIGFPPGAKRGSAGCCGRCFCALPRFQSMRRTGSAALNLAYVACGRFDASWSFSTRIWDMAAGILLVREAGGVASGPLGGPVDSG